MEITLDSPYEVLNRHFRPLFNCPIQVFRQRDPTFLDIAGFPHYENVISNLYKFFLEDQKYGLGSMFLGAMLDCIGRGDINMSTWIVQREGPNDFGRIDLIIKDDEQNPQTVIVIENKIYHHLEGNDLAGYLRQYKNLPTVAGVLLTLRSVAKRVDNYTNITHQQWMEAVKKRVGANMSDIHSRYLILLQDFFQHIDSFYETPVNMDAMRFLLDNAEKIDALSKLQERALEQIEKQLKENAPEGWGQPRSSGKSVAFTQGEFTLYVTTDQIFKPNESAYRIELWLKGKDFVKRWKESQTESTFGSISIQKNRNTNEWALVGSRKYSLEHDKINTFGDTVNGIIASEWKEFVKYVHTVLATK